ncbi:uncharacterized protein [Henckelia pumila]|uniref:uncharacterized protein isoform X2 n=1 Tax=Henckelia pumila TaxID=405737 RepID=UPI003C6DE4FA
MGNDPDWLPEGWEVSVRIRGSGKRDKYYINLSNGLKYNSKPELLRYLKNAGKHQLKELKSMDKQCDIVVKKIAADSLPPGWIKEIRTKKKGGKTRRDPSSTGTNRGRLNKRLITKNATGNKRLASEPELAACPKVPATSNYNMAGENCLEHRAKVDNSQAMELYDKLQFVNTAEEREDIKEEVKISPDSEADKNADRGSTGARMENKARNAPNKPRAIKMEGGMIEDKRLVFNHVESSVVEDQTIQSESERFPKKIGFKSEVRGSKEGDSSVVLQDTPPEVNKNNEKQGHKNKRKRLTNKWTNNLPRRTSKRLARAEADSSPQVKTRNHANAEAPLSCDAKTNSAEKTVNCDPAKEHSMKWIRENATNNKLKDIAILPSRDDEKVGKHLHSSLKDLLTDPCIEFAIKTLGGVIIDDMNKVKDCPVPSNPSPRQISDSCFSSVLPPGDLWSDPCFEFAVKTLGGEIPIEYSSHTRVSF